MVYNRLLVSIVVPIFKVEKFMDKCIYSIINQTYKNLEIILIDDGSPDCSGFKSDEWSNKDERIKVIHQDNAGVSSARNKGIQNAEGEYILFVDSDDWLPVDAVNQLVTNAEANNADLVMGVALSIGTLKKEYYGLNTGLLFHTDIPSQMIEFSNLIKTQLGPWAKLYKNSIIKERALGFPVGIAYGEDRIFNWMYLKYCKTISTIPNKVYIYSQLNLTRACGRYYENVNEWMGIAVNYYSQLFPANEVDARNNVLDTAEKQFSVCCEHYYEHLSNDSSRYYEKIQETQLIFQKIIKKYLDEKGNSNSTNCKQMQFIWNNDVDRLCEIYSVNSKKNRQSWIKRVIRNILVKVMQFKVYKLNMKSQGCDKL